ncbi:16S rRNA (cytidine(1402)-2'-O)-methyltransferase [Glutamicibacter uratoxydans]|uniref:16S rRNA (cytidine(1402)-2'-O)-methyltransferase n=1 Tax=Glutamicibacter uratoxydans TaxID=43667 RepID=UPI003D6DDAC0
MQNTENTGQIVLGATPIGNLSDASPRLREIMASADLVAAEDTRNFHHLAQALGVRPTGRVMSLHEHNEQHKISEVLDAVRGGATVLVVSDAGMPAVSDPGFPLVEAALAAGLLVTAVPGPSAVLTALALSGLPTGRFTFEGFLPRKAGERRRRLESLVSEERTMVFFESPHRLAAFLTSVAEVFGGERQVAVARELTKKFEEVKRGPVAEVLDWAAAGVRGEIAVVVAGTDEVNDAQPEDHVGQVEESVAAGIRLKEAVAQVAQKQGLKKRELYEAVLAQRQNGEN